MKDWFKRQTGPVKGFLVGLLIIVILAITTSKLKASDFPPQPDGAVFYQSGECEDPETGAKGLCAIFFNADRQEGEPSWWLIFFVEINGETRAMYVKQLYEDGTEDYLWVSPRFMAEN